MGIESKVAPPRYDLRASRLPFRPSPSHLDTHVHTQRIARLADALSRNDLDGLVLNPGPTLGYATGLDFHLMERPVLLFLSAEGKAAIVVPKLELQKLEDAPFEMEAFSYTEQTDTWPDAFADALQSVSLMGGRIGGEARTLRLLELEMIRHGSERRGKTTQVIPADELVGEIRSRKDAAEVAAIERAVRVAENAVTRTLETVRYGETERELAQRLIQNLLSEGSDLHLPFPPIVSFGENSANPHASPGDRELRSGDMILIDWGARVDGYVSDMTRVFAAGELPAELARIAEIVEQANAAGREAASRPGVTAADVDHATRQVIVDAGYGEQFVHRTGHGMGLEAHEEPYIREGNDVPLRDGHCFTVEPGVYVSGLGGVRIEDDLILEGGTVRSLTSLPRGVQTVLQ
jgi:Xaa-Pro dipeptidase